MCFVIANVFEYEQFLLSLPLCISDTGSNPTGNCHEHEKASESRSITAGSLFK